MLTRLTMHIPASWYPGAPSGVVTTEKIDPKITANTTALPFISWLQSITGAILTVMVILCVVVLVGAAGSLMASKSMGSRGMSDKSAGVLVWAIAGAIIIGSASAIIAWATGQALGFK